MKQTVATYLRYTLVVAWELIWSAVHIYTEANNRRFDWWVPFRLSILRILTGKCSGSSMFKSKTARCTTFKPKEVHSHSGSSVAVITCTSDELHLHWCRSRHHLVCMTLRPKSGVAENLVLIQQVRGSQTAKLKPSIHIMQNVWNLGGGENTITNLTIPQFPFTFPL